MLNRKYCLIWLLQYNNKELLLCDFLHNASFQINARCIWKFCQKHSTKNIFLVNQVYANDDNLTQYTFICTFYLSRILSNKLSLVRKVSTMFTLTLIQAGDGETDPRNLLILFSTKLSILTSLDVRHHTEEIFEVTSLLCLKHFI